MTRVLDDLAELRDLEETLPCGHCAGLGLIPAESFGCDEDGAPWTDEEQPCPEGCVQPRWLQAERNDARDDREQVRRLNAERVALLAKLDGLDADGEDDEAAPVTGSEPAGGEQL